MHGYKGAPQVPAYMDRRMGTFREQDPLEIDDAEATPPSELIRDNPENSPPASGPAASGQSG